ncbi:von Willebrand factor A domain-containing protein 7-like [Aplochiton taeniatus]
MEPMGGINKDTIDASHGILHFQAVDLALAASIELMEDVREAAGDKEFLSWRGTDDKPSLYILVPFNDPDIGPVTKTTDPDVFRNALNSLKTRWGGGPKEPSLSAVQLALTTAPPASDIFVFTDGEAYDLHLIGMINALIEITMSRVNFMLTGSLSGRGRRSLKGSKAELYGELAEISGGQAIQVTKTQLLHATSIITEASSPLQVVSGPAVADRFAFSVDQSVNTLTVYITGRSLSFTLTSPSGLSQSNLELNGSLGTIQTVGNFLTLRLNKEVGTWKIRMTSTQPYTLKVIGQSAVDFLFNFVKLFEGPHPGFAALETRPSAGNATLLVTVTGSDSVTVTEVALVETSGSGEVNGAVEPLGGREFLVRLDRIPSGNFVVRLRGEETSSTSSRAAAGNFQRQSSTSLRASSITLTVDSDDFLKPGSPFSVPFTVATNGTGGTYTIRATNDRGFSSYSPTSLLLVSGGVASGTVTLTAPSDTVSGSDVTLTIEAEAPGATDTNYAVLRLSVFTPVTDIFRPVCQVLSVSANCSDACSLTTWQLSANLTDGNGTGIESVRLRQGNGTLNTSTVVGAHGYSLTLVSYSASCCSPDVELVAVDRVGNVGSCFSTIRKAEDGDSANPFGIPGAVIAGVTFGVLLLHELSLVPSCHVRIPKE